MKKFLMILPILALLLTGCGEKKEDNNNEKKDNGKTGTIACTFSNDQGAYKLDAEYVIHYNGDFVEYVETTETVSSESEVYLNQMETELKKLYDENEKNYGGYTVNITNENGKVVSKVKIDYSKMDLEKLVNDQPAMSAFIKDKKFTKTGAQSIYEAMNATCK